VAAPSAGTNTAKSYLWEDLVLGFQSCLKNTADAQGYVQIDDEVTWSKCKNSYSIAVGSDFAEKLGNCLKLTTSNGKVQIDDEVTWSKCKVIYAGTKLVQLSPQPDPPGMPIVSEQPKQGGNILDWLFGLFGMGKK